jgi:hypothetical protein
VDQAVRVSTEEQNGNTQATAVTAAQANLQTAKDELANKIESLQIDEKI